MQKIRASASILIRSIFLSLIISFFFVSISTKISKNIRLNSKNIKTFDNQNKIKNKIKNKDYKDERLLNNEAIYFNQNKILKKSLKKNENIEIKFEQNSDIDINITIGGPIFYNLSGSISASGILETYRSLNNFSGSIILNNLGTYTVFNLNSTKEFIPPEINYKIIKNIGNKNIVKNNGIIKTN